MSNFYLVLYIIAWAICLNRHYKQTGKFGVGCLILTSYLIYAILSLFLFNNEYYGIDYKPLNLLPFVYLFIMLLIATIPALSYDKHQFVSIQRPNIKIIYAISVVYILATISQLNYVATNMIDGITKILISSSAARDLYADYHNTAATSGSVSSSGFSLLVLYYNFFRDICILMTFYILTLKKYNKYILYGLVGCLIVNILIPLSQGLRTEATFTILTMVLAYILFLDFYPQNRKRKLNKFFKIGICVLTLPILLVTVGRNLRNPQGAIGGIADYLGQCNLKFNNYCFDMDGIRYGDRTMNQFKQFLGFPNMPESVMEVRDLYKLRLDDGYFSTFIGDFVIDFGLFWTAIIIIVFNFLVLKIVSTKSRKVLFHNLLLYYFTMCVCFQGGFYLFSYAFKANMRIVAVFLLYFIFKYDYKLTPSCNE